MTTESLPVEDEDGYPGKDLQLTLKILLVVYRHVPL